MSATTSTTWPGVRVSCYDERAQDELLLHGVRPILDTRSFVVRHWLRGPHLRICVPSPSPQGRAQAARLAAHLADHVLRHPSRSVVDGGAMLRIHALLAAREAVTEPLTPLIPDNSVELAEFDRRITILGSPAAADVVEKFYAESQSALWSGLERIRAGTDRATLALDVLCAVVVAVDAPLPTGFVSYRSHAEGFVIGAADPGQVRAVLGNYDARYRASASERVLHWAAALRSGPGAPDHVGPVVDALRALRPAIDSVVADHGFRLPAASATGRTHWDPTVLARSAFHQRLQRSPAFTRLLTTDPGFARYRVLVNLVYLHLNRLGVTPTTRAVVAHLAANALERHLGCSSEQILDVMDSTGALPEVT